MSRPPLAPSPEVIAEADRLRVTGLSWRQISLSLGWPAPVLRLAVEKSRRLAALEAP